MSIHRHAIACFAVWCCLFAGAAQAEYQWQFGPVAGLQLLDADCCDTDAATGLGVSGGVFLDNGFGSELEYVESVSDGSLADFDLSVRSTTVFVGWRSAGSTYFKGRIGAVAVKLTADDASDSGSGAAFGGALGFMMHGSQRLEIAYTRQQVVSGGQLALLTVSYLF